MTQGILGFGLLAISLALVPGIAIAALGPINKAAGDVNAPTRFQISDLLWLSALLQAVLAFCMQTIGVNLREAFLPICGFLTLTVIAIWAAGVSFLSRAGVASVWKRACLLLISLPVTLGLMIVIPVGIMASATAAKFYWDEIARGERTFDPTGAVTVTLAGLASVAGVSALTWGLRWLSFWIVGEAAAGQPGPPDVTSPAIPRQE